MLGGYISDLETGDVFDPVEYVLTPFICSEYAHGVEENCEWVHSPHNPAGRHVRAAFGLERTSPAVGQRRAIANGVVGTDMAGRGERLTGGAGVNVLVLVEGEVSAGECAIVSLAPVPDGNVGRDVFVLDQPAEELARTIGRVGGQPLGLQAKTPLGAIDCLVIKLLLS